MTLKKKFQIPFRLLFLTIWFMVSKSLHFRSWHIHFKNRYCLVISHAFNNVFVQWMNKMIDQRVELCQIILKDHLKGTRWSCDCLFPVLLFDSCSQDQQSITWASGTSACRIEMNWISCCMIQRQGSFIGFIQFNCSTTTKQLNRKPEYLLMETLMV